MDTLGAMHGLGAAITLVLTSARDFAIGGGKSTAVMVAGAIIGTLVGGSSTVATSQMAFEYGFSAIWFSLGGGIGCLFLALFMVRPMRKNGYLTLQQMIQSEYGPRAGFLSIASRSCWAHWASSLILLRSCFQRWRCWQLLCLCRRW